jgi:hypothetical protein
MEWAIVEVDRLDVGERAPKTTLTSFPKVEFLGIADLVLRIGVGAVVVGGVLHGSFQVVSAGAKNAALRL